VGDVQLGSALVTLLDSLLVKGAVMVITAWLLARLVGSLRAAPGSATWLELDGEDRLELRWLLAALVGFAVSEVACAVEVVEAGSVEAMDWLHSGSSAVGMGLFAVWLTRVLDRKLLRYGERSCLFNRVCQGCTFSEPARCKLLGTLSLVAALVALAGLPLLWVSTEAIPADPRAYALPFPALNAWYDQVIVPWVRAHAPGNDPTTTRYFFLHSTLVLELRAVPLLASVLAVAALGLLRVRREVAGLRLLAFSAGVLGYGYLEAVLFAATGDPIFGSLAHEGSELWFLLVTTEGLRRLFAPGRPKPHRLIELEGTRA
jgi:hypothetical protein